MKLFEVIEELVSEHGLNRSTLNSIVSEVILAAYNKKYPDLLFKAEIEKKTGELLILVEKEVVASVQDEDEEISLKKAKHIAPETLIGDKIWIPFTGIIGRIEVLWARQLMLSKIRKVEALAVYEEFKDKLGDIIHGVIHKCEKSGVVVKIGETMAFLPNSLTIPGDKCTVGYPIKTLLKEVLLEPCNDNQLILDRASEQFLAKLFELEIPEIYEKLVEIKKIVRVPGYKAKILVQSNDKNIDPVGALVGQGGSRIKPIINELGSEKIDVIPWSESPEILIKNSLKPAQIDRLEIIKDKEVKVWLDESQRSVAIGKMGQNIGLASKLTGYEIQLATSENRNKLDDTKQLFQENEEEEDHEG